MIFFGFLSEIVDIEAVFVGFFRLSEVMDTPVILLERGGSPLMKNFYGEKDRASAPVMHSSAGKNL